MTTPTRGWTAVRIRQTTRDRLDAVAAGLMELAEQGGEVPLWDRSGRPSYDVVIAWILDQREAHAVRRARAKRAACAKAGKRPRKRPA